MKLHGLLSLLQSDELYQACLQRVAAPPALSATDGPLLSLSVIETARPYVIAALQHDWPGPVIVVTGRPERARSLVDGVRAWSSMPDSVDLFHAPDTIFYDRTAWDRDTVVSRVNTLSALQQMGGNSGNDGRGRVIISSIWALMARSVSPMAFRRATRAVKVGDELPMFTLLERLVRAGYDPAVVVEEPGAFAHRGSLVDIYPPDRDGPIRIDFFGDEIDSIRAFDPGTQRTSDTLDEVRLTPASEALPEWGQAAATALHHLDLSACNTMTRQHMTEEIDKLIQGIYFGGIEFYLPYLYPQPNTLLDFLPDNALVVIDDMLTIETASVALENQATSIRAEMVEDALLPANCARPYIPWTDLKRSLFRRRTISMGYGAEEHGLLAERFAAAPTYAGQIRDALVDIEALRHEGQRIVIVSRQAERISDLLHEQREYLTPISDIVAVPERNTLQLVDGILAQGWAYPRGDLIVLTDAELFGWVRTRTRRPARRRLAPETVFSDLNVGDYVVHIEYGIGKYHGMARKVIGGLEREYMEIEYAQGDRLYVPSHQADRVSRYVGADERQPYVHRLGGTEWARVRERAERSVRQIAEELLELYASREVTPGFAFSPDAPWQRELEASFPFEETDDQLRALTEVKEDMEQPRPMDRLICGDVGYGKTEVALRAAFKAVMDGKQVAVLVPTTVLAQQHYQTFRRRLRAFPVVVEMLSRFRSAKEQDDVVSELISGKVDIVIGTHRLLSNDVSFKDLGLVIIDEEQRFGVTHKEHLKQVRRHVDVLTLTATPIPRTLYMALGNIRDMSIIDTPPEDRLAVRTQVLEWDEATIRKAVLRELDRGGQIYFVHNRVQDIEIMAARLRQIVPEASLIIGHGQMPEEQLSQVMLGFAQGEYDMLLCTTIIESGLDIPNVNTIIIDRADTFGLAQLYQLRGRVGRAVVRAYAYLLYNPPLTEIAQQRLQTIQEASELGAGFRVAMRDMQIRGAGELLGAEQHGQIAAIGFDLYTRLLQSAVEELRESSGEAGAAMRRAQHATAAGALTLNLGASIDLPVSAFLPEGYILDNGLRLRLYRRLARLESPSQVDEVIQELSDRFGPLPEPVQGLLYLLRVRTLAEELSIESVRANEKQVSLSLPVPLTASAARTVMNRHPHVTCRGSRIWLDLLDGWQERLVKLLTDLLDTVMVPA